jgi:E3 ubiquitin-protein ligase CCNP1IP1
MAHLLLFGTSLTRCDSDDIVFTSLNPSQSFKTTILAGMNPNMINDICGRALGFWTYQVTQEANFQQMILRDAQEVRSSFTLSRKSLTIDHLQRASVMEKKIDTLLREANSELASTSVLVMIEGWS